MGRLTVVKTAVTFTFLALAQASWAQVRYPAKPGPRDFVVDEAGLLETKEVKEIKNLCDEVLTRKRAPIIVVTLKSLGEYGAKDWPLERYAMNLMAEWGIGWSEWNHGMLILVAVEDRRARIELGADWGRGKDLDAQRVMRELIVPHFKAGDYGKGLVQGVKGLRAIAMELRIPRGRVVDRRPAGTGSFMWIILVVIGIAVVGSMFRGGYGYGGGYGRGCSPLGMGCLGGMMGSMLFGGFSSWGRGFGGGGGGWGGSWGGGSFGGGFSGGGGATGSW